MPASTRSQPADGRWVWGVDVALVTTDCVAVKREQSFGFALAPSTFTRPRGMDLPLTLAVKRTALIDSVKDWARSAPPIAVFVEVPMGRHGNPALSAAFGVTLEAIQSVLRSTLIYPVNISDWKRHYPGFANASKEQLVRAAAEDGFTHARQDAVDAYCIGRAGDRMLTEG